MSNYPNPLPAPPAMDRCWIVNDRGNQTGPHTQPELANLVANGTIAPFALTWRDGLPRWVPIGTIVPISTYLPSTPAAYSNSTNNSNKLAAGLCAILLGGFGIHKFILGYNTAGIIMLLVSVLTCGIGGIVMHVIGIIEGIIYLTKSDEQFNQEYVVQHKEWF